MIEVEKKFEMTGKRALAKLLQGFKYLGSQEIEDIYYDTPDFKFIKKGMRLRKRNGKFELKADVRDPRRRGADQRHEIDEEKEILRRMGFSGNDNLLAIVNGQLAVLCTIKTKRQKYQKGEVSVDLDVTDFGYEMGEIEILVPTEAEIAEAERKIITLATESGIKIAKMPGKVAECLRRTMPVLYQELYGHKSGEMRMK